MQTFGYPAPLSGVATHSNKYTGRSKQQRRLRRAHGCLVDYCVALPLESFRGRKGIEMVGATKSERRVLNVAE